MEREREQELKRGEEREREREGEAREGRENRNTDTKRNPRRVGPPSPSAFAHLIEDRVPSSRFDVCAKVLI